MIEQMIGKRIRSIRKAKGYTQEQLAERAGLSSKYLSRIELGKENPTLNVFISISSGLGIEPIDIFNIQHEEENIEKLRKIIRELLKEANQEKLKLTVKLIKAVLH